MQILMIMIIKKLQIAGLRAFEQAEFTFQPGMNLLVGVNGVGKTTVLDALRICLSQVLPEVTASRSQKIRFEETDIQFGASTLQVSCDFELDNIEFNLLLIKQRENTIPNKEIGNVRDQTTESPDKEETSPLLLSAFPGFKKARQQPLGIYFSTRRSLVVEQAPSKTNTAGGQAAAFAESLLSSRELNLRLIAQWFIAQEELGAENPAFLKHVEVLRKAVHQFLPDFTNLRTVDIDGNISFVVDKLGKTLRVAQLSDGERGMLAIVLDLARRLSQANPGLDNPIKDGVGVVLIDELDLHLHPKWQRSIVKNLTNTFENCQFIITTHSPQIIGEVKPDRITIVDKDIYQPTSSFGMDSSRILEEIMDTVPRNIEVNNLLSTLHKKIDEEDIPEAKKILKKVIRILGPNDPEVTRPATMIDFLEGEINE